MLFVVVYIYLMHGRQDTDAAMKHTKLHRPPTVYVLRPVSCDPQSVYYNYYSRVPPVKFGRIFLSSNWA